MKKRYEALKNILNTLFIELETPMGSWNDNSLSISMYESTEKKLIATTTKFGYTLVSSEGETLSLTDVEEVKAAFIVYFTTDGPLLSEFNL